MKQKKQETDVDAIYAVEEEVGHYGTTPKIIEMYTDKQEAQDICVALAYTKADRLASAVPVSRVRTAKLSVIDNSARVLSLSVCLEGSSQTYIFGVRKISKAGNTESDYWKSI